MKLLKTIACLLASVILMSGCGFILVEDWETADPSATTVAKVDPDKPVLTPPETIPEATAEQKPSRRSEAEAALEKLYVLDLSGTELIIAVNTDGDDTLFSSSDDPFYSFYDIRNGMVTGKYGLKIVVMSSDSTTMRADLAASVKAGSDSAYYSDVIEAPAAFAGSLAVSGLLMNLRKLPYYTVSTEGISACGNYGNYCFFDISESTRAWSTRPVLYLNTSLAGRELTSQLTQAVLNGGYDFEFFLSAVSSASLPDGKYGLTVDYGETGYAAVGEIIAARSGVKFTTVVNGYPNASFTAEGGAEKLTSLIGSIMQLTYVPGAAQPDAPEDTGSTAETTGTAESGASLPGSTDTTAASPETAATPVFQTSGEIPAQSADATTAALEAADTNAAATGDTTSVATGSDTQPAETTGIGSEASDTGSSAEISTAFTDPDVIEPEDPDPEEEDPDEDPPETTPPVTTAPVTMPVYTPVEVDPDTPAGQFISGNSLFHLGQLGDIAGVLRGQTVRWTVLPLPAESSDVQAYSPASANKAVLCVPANNKRTEQTGIYLSATAAASGNWIGDEYANYCLTYGFLRDNDSYFTLCAIIDEPEYFDFAYLYGAHVANLDAATYLALRKCATEGTPVEETALPLITKLNTALKKLRLPG